jgi:hypothetical protein
VRHRAFFADGKIIVETAAVKLTIDPSDLPASEVLFWTALPRSSTTRENLFGTLSTLDTNGEHLRLYPSINRYDRAHIRLEPGVASRSGAAVYDDSGTILLGADGLPKPRAQAETDLYVFAFERDYPAAVRALYSLCGSPPVLPRWALGNWWSRYWPYTQQDYLDLMDNFADDEIPISVAVIDMDWHYVAIDETFGITRRGLNDPAHAERTAGRATAGIARCFSTTGRSFGTCTRAACIRRSTSIPPKACAGLRTAMRRLRGGWESTPKRSCAFRSP